MGAMVQRKRKMTARQAAAQFGVTERTVRNMIAQPRAEYLAERRERYAHVLALRAEGLKWREIGERLGITENHARRLGFQARKALNQPHRYT